MSAVAVQIVRKVSTLFGGRLSQSINASSDHLHILGAVAATITFLADLANDQFAFVLLPICILAGCATFIAIIVPDWEDIEPVKVAHAIVLFGAITVLSGLVYISKEYFGYDPATKLTKTVTDSIVGLKNDTDQHFKDTAQHFKDTDRKLEMILAALTPYEQKKIQIASLTTDVSVSILVALHVIVDQRVPTLDSAQQNSLFLQKANEYARIERSLAEFRPADPRAQTLVQQAKDALAHGDFAGALDSTRQAGEIERSSSQALETLAHNRALTAARALESSAAIARVSMRYDEAVNDLSGAAKLAAGYDPHYARQLTTAKADTLLQQGNEIGDQAAISQAADIYRSVLSTASDTGADVASAQSGLNQALTKLGSRTDATPLDRRSGAATPVQDNLGPQRSATDRRENLRQVSAARYGSPAASRMSERAVATPGRAQERSNLASGSARSLQRRHLHELSAARSPIEQGRSTIGGSPGGASEAASQVRSSGSDDQPGLFSRLKNWAGGSRGSSASSSPPAAEEPRSQLGASQLFRPSSLDEQRSLVSRSRGQTSPQPSVGSTHHRKHSTN